MNKRLVLIDGHAILHRAYHALPPLTNNKGVVTNAVYGFMTMLLRVLSNLKPDFLAVAFDLPQPTFRQQQYTQYQARRPEMESNLSEQIPLLHELLEKLKIEHFEVAGFEADDVIGTLAKQATDFQKTQTVRRSGRSDNLKIRKSESSDISEVIIVTGDRDMLQLVNGQVKVCVPVKGLSETKIYDEAMIRAEYRVEPCQWVDVKALKGDASDNYPGVRGIGPKTAQELIGIYGNLEELYKNLGKLDPKTAKKLAEGAEDAGMAKKLATIVTDVPVHLDLSKAGITGIDWNSGIKYMREELGFKTIVERVEREYLNKDNKNRENKKNSEQLGLI